MASVYIPFDSYSFWVYARAGTKAQIQLYESSEYKGTIEFRTADLPQNTVDKNGFGRLYYAVEDFPIILDLLRNESPLFIWVNTENGIGGIASEEQEPVGEGE